MPHEERAKLFVAIWIALAIMAIGFLVLYMALS